MKLRARLCFGLIIPGALLATYLFVRSRAAYRQTAREVVIRRPGDRLLGSPEPAAEEAKKDVEFAWLSQAAYDQIPPPEGNQPPARGCMDPYAGLSAAGWSPWLDFPDSQLHRKIANSHLRVEVWVNPSQNALAVAFGGTVASNLRDWEANLRWFIPFHDDEYTKLVKEVGPQFIQEFLKRKQLPDGLWLAHAKIYAAGHSLGGGLAQEFAYSLPVTPEVPRVTQVYAFDPSPVTGFTSVSKSDREVNRQNLAIDRVYERGEVLATLRSLTNFIDPPRTTKPIVRQVRYNLFSRKNPIKGHSISELACKLKSIATGP